MPPSSQRRRTRKQPEADIDKSEREDVDEVETPLRKRRKQKPNTQVAAEAKPAATSTPRKNRSSDIKVYEDEESMEQDEVDNVIRNLREAKYAVAARSDYANEVHELRNPEGKQAYAKIAGKSWTFYVDHLQVRIGRPGDESKGDANGGAETEADSHTDASLVHIDLGPSKLVSRQHAEIRFDNHAVVWYIAVNGRNGIRLDGRPISRGQSATLHSGCVIEIAGTQMMFVTPDVAPQIHSSILAQGSGPQDDDDDDDDGDLPDNRQPGRETPVKPSGARSGGQRPPSSNARQPGNHGNTQRGSHIDSAAHELSTEAMSSNSRNQMSPAFSRGVMLESAEDVDYSADSAQDLKPPHSYAQLIGMAILSTPEEKLTLAKIYDWIKERYAFYRFANPGWQNSIRHNLSLNKSFEKVARRTDEPGKGMKWQIAPEHREEFLKKGLNGARKQPGRTSSAPVSPAKETADRGNGEEASGSNSRGFADVRKTPRAAHAVKASPGSTPPVSHYPHLKQAYTPERAPADFDASSPSKTFVHGISPFPLSIKKSEHWNGMTEAAAAGTPGGPRIPFGSEPHEHLVTPIITKHAPKLAPPSTARLPSHYMPMSSPAPFWKYADFGSTPAKFAATSPIKAEAKPGHKDESGDDEKEAAKAQVTGVRSSSPPLPEGEVGQGSPTRAASQRGAEHKFAVPSPVVLQPSRAQESSGASKGTTGLPAARASVTPVTAAEQDDADESGDDEDGGGLIDLARGFQPIGSFHRSITAGIVGRN